MSEKELISKTIDFVKQQLSNAEGGHDWFHTERVYKTSLDIAKKENADILVVTLAALLHDVADSKFHDGDEQIGPKTAERFLMNQNVDGDVITEVINIIKHLSFKKTFDNTTHYSSKELEIVQDADRLDAIGAIGIARCFNYGGYKNRILYDPCIPPNLNMSKEEYKLAKGPTLNHFYEKLLLLKDQMNTEIGKKLAAERHGFMEQYLKQFLKEWHVNL